MKKIILSILIIITFEASAQFVNILDVNLKAYLVGNTAINTGGDPNEIESTEASAFTGAIYCNSLSISDMTGIEAFTALTSLSCNGNSLTSLDVFQNTFLTFLSCHSNSLTSLDVSNNTALTYLDIHANSLTSLDVSNNTTLIQLNCFYNAITILDVSSNISLTQLGCENNFLTSLNVANGNNSNFSSFYTANNPNLSCIQVDNATYSITNWTNIDATTSFSTNCIVVEINETTNNLELTPYPNPTTGMVTFSTSEKISSIELYNLTGQIVGTFTNTKTMDLSPFPSGVYMVKITSNQEVGMVKLIKE